MICIETLMSKEEDETDMKKITMFHITECKYCDFARQAIAELIKEYPEYANVEIEMINEDEHPEIIENYDYWAVPSLFIDHDKILKQLCSCHMKQ